MAYEQGAPDKIPPNQPNPVIVGPGLSALGEGAYVQASIATPALVSQEKPRVPQNEEQPASYFSEVPGTATAVKDAYAKSPSSPSDAASGVTSGPELLRRLSLAGGAHLTPATPLTDPRADHPGLQLTGRLISAAFCIPYKVSQQAGSDWVGKHPFFYYYCPQRARQGNSMLIMCAFYLVGIETSSWDVGLV